MRYFCWVIFVNLSQFLIDEIYWTNLKFGFWLEYLFWTLYIYEHLHLGYFCFCMSTILLVEYEFMTCGVQNFMEESETRKNVRKYWACCKFIWVHILFLTFIWFYFY